VENEWAKSKDRKAMNQHLEKISEVTKVLEADDVISIGIAQMNSDFQAGHDFEAGTGSTGANHDDSSHSHKTLKLSCVTR